MRHIKKTIHLEELKSRVPSFANAYNGNGVDEQSFTPSMHLTGNTLFQGNYNLYPLNIKVPIGNYDTLKEL